MDESMENCAPASGGKAYPERRQSKSTCKGIANNHAGDMFQQQGLGRLGRKSRILILDTPMLITTIMLATRFPNDIEEIVIVEINAARAKRIKKRAAELYLTNAKITVETSEVIDYLCDPDNGTFDFVWLDIMSTQLKGAKRILKALQSVRCLIVTVTNRIKAGITAIKRTLLMKRLLASVYKHKILDWGYNGSVVTCKGVIKHGVSMQMIAFGNIKAKCLGRLKTVTQIPGCVNKVYVSFYGWNKTRVIRRGTRAHWKPLEGSDVPMDQ